MATFDIYKPGQGKWTRTITFASGMLIATTGAYWLSSQLHATTEYLQFGLPVVLWIGVGLLMFFLVNRTRTADFMIATEGEMKKVSWSSRREITGSTKVVIFTTFAMAILLFVVDVIFNKFFVWIGVLQQAKS